MMTLLISVSCIMIFFLSSFHSLSYLIMAETMVMANMLGLLCVGNYWMTPMFFLVVSVCAGAYGIALYITLDRSKGLSFFFSL